MNCIIKIDELIESVADIRNLKKGFLTNFYLDITKHTLWINKGVMYLKRINNTLFIVKKNKTFWNVFYCSTTIDELVKSIEIFNDLHKDIILMYDVVCNKNLLELFKDVFSARMNEYCSLVRMSRINIDQSINLSDDIKLASKGQAQELLDILNFYFDEKSEQIPYIEELESLIEKGNVFIYEKENHILGFTIFEKNISTLYLRYWFVHPEYRNMKIGSKLLNHFFNSGKDCKRHQLWVIETNKNAIVRYEHSGFRSENLFDTIYTNKKLKYNSKYNEN